jgi:hypothetical protein
MMVAAPSIDRPLTDRVLAALRPGVSWTAIIDIVRALDHPDPVALGNAIGKLLRDYRIGWAIGDIREFPYGAWALADLNDKDWTALRGGATNAGGLTQTVFRSFLGSAHASGVKEAEIRYMRQLRASVVNSTRGHEFMPRIAIKLQLLRQFSEQERERKLWWLSEDDKK